MRRSARRLDGAGVEVIRHYVVATADEMRATLMRTSFNPSIYEARDFGISIYDADLELVAEAPGATLFLGANDHSIAKGVEYVGRDHLEPGDVVVLNYPYWNSAHTYDATVFAPVFDEAGTSPFAFLCIRAHWKDLGAKDPGYVLDSTDMHQEGLIFPGTKVFKRGREDRQITELIRFNSRLPEQTLGDLHAQVAAIRTGERRLKELVSKFGRRTFASDLRAILDHGEATTRSALARLPQGTWSAREQVDDDGIGDELVPMQATVSIRDGGFHVDFAGSASATRGPINMPFGMTIAICRVVLKALTSPFEPTNGGQFRPLTIAAEPGTIFHAIYPAPTFTLWATHIAVELLHKALAQAVPDRVPASSGGDVPGFMMVGRHPGNGQPFSQGGNNPVGWGATSRHDGASALNHLTQSTGRSIPIEVLETMSSMFVERFELRTDSGGPGRFRGGLGIRREIRFLSDGEFLSVIKKTRTRPWALAGGAEPEPNAVILFPGTAEERRVSTRRVAVRAGDRIHIVTAGGGGFGDPRERDPERVRADVRAGYVSPQAAGEIYALDGADA